jgi:hypothetical protein
MQITNYQHLPEPLVSAVKVWEPERDKIGVTTLCGPPMIRALKLKHWDELSEDAADRIWATMGSLMHKLLEGHVEEGALAEGKLETQWNGYIVRGIFDHFTFVDGTLTDYKFVSIYTAKDGIKPEWEQQLNVYAELMRQNGYDINKLAIVAIYRDWQKSKAQEGGYPSKAVQTFYVPLWAPERARAYVEQRLQVHARADAGDVDECTPSERWERPTRHALMKKGNKRAVRLYSTRDEAMAAIKEPNHYVELRQGSNVRCESYCVVSQFCPTWERLRNGKAS